MGRWLPRRAAGRRTRGRSASRRSRRRVCTRRRGASAVRDHAARGPHRRRRRLGFGRETTVFVDPYSGAVLGEGSKGARAFFRAVTDWHRWLGASGERRPVGARGHGRLQPALPVHRPERHRTCGGRRASRASTCARSPSSKGGLDGKARDFNWHNVFGFWSALPLVFVVASGVVISYPWASDLAYRLTGSEPPRRAAGRSRRGRRPQAGVSPRTVGKARQGVRSRRSRASIARGPEPRPGTGLAEPEPRGSPPRPTRPGSFTIDTSTGRPAAGHAYAAHPRPPIGRGREVERYAGQSAGRKVAAGSASLHTGEASASPGRRSPVSLRRAA